MKVRDCHAVVTGASQGIGAALVRELTHRGAEVTMIARNESALQRIADETGATPHVADLSKPALLEDLARDIVRQRGKVDALINNAALGGVGEFVAMAPESMVDHINTNLLAPMILTRALLPAMLERRHGTVAMLSSVAGEMAMRNATPYAATKTGLSMLASTLQREMRNHPVTVMLTVLGEVETPMLAPVRADPVMAVANRRIGKLRTMSPDYVARRIVDGIEKDRKLVVLPGVLRPLVGLRNIPSYLMDLAMLGVR